MDRHIRLAARLAGGADRRRADDLPARVLALGRVRPVRLHARPGAPWVGLDNFAENWKDPVWRASLWRTLWFSVHDGRRRAHARPPARARDAAAVPRAAGADDDVRRSRSSSARSSWAGSSTSSSAGRYGVANQLASWVWPGDVTIDFSNDSPWLYIVADHRRRLAVDAVHVRDPARRAGRDPRHALRGGRPRRGEAAAVVLLRDAAAAPADHPHRGHVPAHRRGEALRHHLLAHARRARDRHVHDVVLPLPAGLRVLPPRPGDGGRLDVPDHALVHLVLARAAAAQAGGGEPL